MSELGAPWPTSRFVRIIRSEIDPEIEQAWNQWYNEKHLPDLLTVPGWLGGRRFRRVDEPNQYVSLWELSTPDAIRAPEMEAVRGNGPFADHVRSGGITYEELFRRTTL